MQPFSYPTIRAILAVAKSEISNNIIDVTKIWDYELNKKAEGVNKKILATTRLLNDIDKFLYQNSVLKLSDVAKSSLNKGILYVNDKGILELTDAFLISTAFERGTSFVAGINQEDNKDKGLYLIESTVGSTKLNTTNIKLQNVLEHFNLPYPNKVLWSTLTKEEYTNRGFRLEFPDNLHG